MPAKPFRQTNENSSFTQTKAGPLDHAHELFGRYAAASSSYSLAKTNATKPALEAGKHAWGDAVSQELLIGVVIAILFFCLYGLRDDVIPRD